jgi:hypothetical protein
MKSSARGIGMRLADALTRNALRTFTLATLLAIIGGVGVWTHNIYAAKVRAEKAARRQAATLNQVMDKLNEMQSEMEQQSQTMEVKLEDLRQANAKLAAFALRTAAQANARSARLEHAVAFSPYPPQAAIAGGRGIVNSSPVDLEAKVCGNLDLKGELKWGPAVEAKGHAEGGVGVDVAGDGGKASVKVNATDSLEGSVAGGGGVSFDVCYAFSPSVNFPTGVDTTALSNAVQTSAQNVAAKIANFLQTHPKITDTALPDTLDALNNIKANVTRQNVLAAIEDPNQTLNNFSAMFQAVPLPGNLNTFVSNPASFLPQASDLTPEALCASPAALTSEVLSTICAKVPPPLKSFDGVSTFLNTFSTLNLSGLQARVSNVEASLTSTCNMFNTDVTYINGTAVTIPGRTLASLRYVSGVSFTPPGVSYSTFDVNLPLISLTPFAPPHNLPVINCPSF